MTTRTRSTLWTVLALVTAATMAQAAGPSPAQTPQDASASSVKVTVTYNGKGTVDGSHQLWIWLFATPDIGPGAIPIAEMSLDKNGATATFASVSADKVWIAVAFDEGGGFGGSAPPPSKSPVALHMDASGPVGVAPGPKAAVTITFDDSQRMP